MTKQKSKAQNKIRILISDDHNLVRQGLINMLENLPDIYIAGEADDGQTLVEKYQQIKPDIVLSDISMPLINGIAAAQEILRINKKAKIIFLTAFANDEYIYKALKIGARGLISKDTSKGELINTIRKVMNEENYFMGKTGKEIESILKTFKNQKSSPPQKPLVQLVEIEKVVLSYIAQGFTSKEIAEKLKLSKRVIDYHRVEIMEKLGIKNLSQLIKFAVEYSFNENKI
jgi:two-component system response regulator NreC